jgi:protein SCO1
MKAIVVFALCASLVSPAFAGGESFSDLVLEPRPGARLPLATQLIEETGNAVPLGRFFGGKPVILVLDYLRCRTICGVVLGNLSDATAGRNYTVLAISIEPRDTPADAAAAKAKYVARDASGKLAPSWHFLTGPEDAVRPIADAVGFRYRYDPPSGQYIHSAGIVIAALDGTVGGYLADLDITPAGLTAALDTVTSGQTTSFGRLLLLCFGQGARSGRYTAAIEAAFVCLNLAGMLAACGLFAWVRRRPHD